MPGDILLCSLPHLIALPCQTRAERAKAPSPVPRSISWQSFESNCDCSALRSSEQQLCTCLPDLPRPALPSSVRLYFGTLPLCLDVPCPAPDWPRFSLSSHRPRLETVSLAPSVPVRTTPSPPPVSSLRSPVSCLASPPPWVAHCAVPILPAFDLQPTWTARLHTSSAGSRRQS